MSAGAASRRAAHRPPRRRGTTAATVVAALVLFYLSAPVVVVIPMSFTSSRYPTFPPVGLSLRWYDEFFFAPRSQWLTATGNSLEIATLTALCATLLGTLAALGLSRLRSRYASTLAMAIIFPIVIPIVVVAIAVYLVYVPLRLNGTVHGVVLAHTMIATGFSFLVVSAALRNFDITLERAAQSLGADPFQTFRRITLPIIAPAVLSGALFAFITSWDEVLIALFLSGNVMTLPRLMWELVRTDLTPTIAAASTLLIVVSTLLLTLAELLRRSQERRASGAGRAGEP